MMQTATSGFIFLFSTVGTMGMTSLIIMSSGTVITKLAKIIIIGALACVIAPVVAHYVTLGVCLAIAAKYLTKLIQWITKLWDKAEIELRPHLARYRTRQKVAWSIADAKDSAIQRAIAQESKWRASHTQEEAEKYRNRHHGHVLTCPTEETDNQ